MQRAGGVRVPLHGRCARVRGDVAVVRRAHNVYGAVSTNRARQLAAAMCRCVSRPAVGPLCRDDRQTPACSSTADVDARCAQEIMCQFAPRREAWPRSDAHFSDFTRQTPMKIIVCQQLFSACITAKLAREVRPASQESSVTV